MFVFQEQPGEPNEADADVVESKDQPDKPYATDDIPAEDNVMEPSVVCSHLLLIF